MSGAALLWLAAFLAFAVGVAHSALGERFILMRLFRRAEELPKLLGDTRFTASTLRFAWHITTLAWWGFAAMLAVAARGALTAATALQVLAVTMLATGAVILVASRGRHLAWPVFAAIGAIAWFAAGAAI